MSPEQAAVSAGRWQLSWERMEFRSCAAADGRNFLEETVQLVQDAGGSGLAIPTDITQKDQIREMMDQVLEQYGTVDILINNAGSWRSIGALHEIDPEVWWRDVEVNLFGSMLMIHTVLPIMLAQDRGIIINMDGGRHPGGTSYASSKAGLMELTRQLAKELEAMKSCVLVVGAIPGTVKTDMTKYLASTRAGQKWLPLLKRRLDKNEVRRARDIAKATIELIQTAKPRYNGKTYNPDTDFSKF